MQLEDAKSYLDKHSLFHVVALLFKGRRLERATLSVWRDLGTGVMSEPGFDGVEDSIQYLSGCADKVRHQSTFFFQHSVRAHAGHDCCTCMTRVLQAVVFEFAPWVLQKRPERAMNIFIKGI